MSECAKCGFKNEEGAKYCSKCGVNLEDVHEETFEKRMEDWGEEFGRRAEKWGEQFGKQVEAECFGLPHGGAIVGLIVGIIIILVGLSWLMGFEWKYFWPFVIIIFGTLIVAGTAYSFSRHR